MNSINPGELLTLTQDTSSFTSPQHSTPSDVAILAQSEELLQHLFEDDHNDVVLDALREAKNTCSFLMTEMQRFANEAQRKAMEKNVGNNTKPLLVSQFDQPVASSPQLSQFEIISASLRQQEDEKRKIQTHYEERIKEVTLERDKLLKECVETKLKLDSQKTLIDSLKTKEREQEEAFQELTKQKDLLYNKVTKYEGERKKFSESYNALQKQVIQIKEIGQEFETNVACLTSFQEQVVATITRVEKSLQQKMSQTDSLLKEKQLHLQTISEHEQALQSLKVEISSKEGILASMQQQLKEEAQKYHDLLENNSKANESLRQHGEHLKQLIEKNCKLETQIASNEQAVSQQKQRFEKILEQKEKRVQEILAQCAAIQKEKEQVSEELSEAIRKKDMELQAKSIQQESLERDLAAVTNKLNELELKSRKMQEDLDMYSTDDFETKQKLHQSELQATLLQQRVSQLETDSNIMSSENQKLTAQVKRMEEDNFKLQILLEEARRQEGIPRANTTQNISIGGRTISAGAPPLSTPKRLNTMPQVAQTSPLASPRLTQTSWKPVPTPAKQQVPSSPSLDARKTGACAKCSKPKYGLMVNCSQCERIFHASCVSTQGFSSIVCDACTGPQKAAAPTITTATPKKSNLKQPQSSGLAKPKPKKLHKITFEDGNDL